MALVKEIESYGSADGKVAKPVAIKDCGEIAEGADDGYGTTAVETTDGRVPPLFRLPLPVRSLLFRISHCISQFTFCISQFAFRISQFTFCISQFAFRISHFAFCILHFAFCISHFACLTLNLFS
jgi:hypothetical protein